MPIILNFIKEGYSALCWLFHYIAPAIFLAFVLSCVYSSKLSNQVQSLETSLSASQEALTACQDASVAIAKESQEQELPRKEADAKKDANTAKACKSKMKIDSTAIQLDPKLDLMQQELTDDILKEIDPSYIPKP